MHKKLLAILLFSGLSSFAQPTITSSNNPVAGDVYNYYSCDSVGPGASGANVTWNFTTLNSNSSSQGTFQSCPGTAGCSTFSGSTLAMLNTGSGAYYIADANRFAWNGEDLGTVQYVYSDPRDIRRYPFSMGTNYTDAHSSTFSTGTISYRNGSVSFNADAYGTLQLPNGNFSNVVRIHYVDTYTDSTYVVGVNLINDYERDVYEWYQQGYHEYLLHVEKLTTFAGDLSPFEFSITTVIYTANATGVASVPADVYEIDLFPVPAQDILNISVGSDIENISIYDLLGKEVVSAAGVKGKKNYSINTEGLATGMYVVKVNGEKGTVTKKIQVQ